jgi:hypothetical protein
MVKLPIKKKKEKTLFQSIFDVVTESIDCASNAPRSKSSHCKNKRNEHKNKVKFGSKNASSQVRIVFLLQVIPNNQGSCQ